MKKITNKIVEVETLFCDICGKEISSMEMPFIIERNKIYDGGKTWNNLIDWLFRAPRKRKVFTFHTTCAERAIFEKMRKKH